MSDFSYEIKRTIAAKMTSGSWSLELNFISWNGRTPVFDLRKWNADHSKMSKGITLTDAELSWLASILADAKEA